MLVITYFVTWYGKNTTSQLQIYIHIQQEKYPDFSTLLNFIIRRVSAAKYLGVTLHENLSCKDHIELVIQLLTKNIYSFKIVKKINTWWKQSDLIFCKHLLKDKIWSWITCIWYCQSQSDPKVHKLRKIVSSKSCTTKDRYHSYTKVWKYYW